MHVLSFLLNHRRYAFTAVSWKRAAFFAGGEVGDDALEGVPHHVVGVGYLVDGEVALEHAALDAKLLDDVEVVGRGCLGKLDGADGGFALVPVVAVVGHAAAADFDEDVLVPGDFGDAALPDFHDLRAPASVGADAERRADVVEDDCYIRERAREVCEFGELRMV